MSDAELRRLEQAWLGSGGAGDELAYLQARLRAGRLDARALKVAAYLGDEVAATFLGVDGGLATKAPKSGLQRWFGDLPGDAAACVKASLAALDHLVASEAARLRPPAQACQNVLIAWLEAPPPAEAEREAVGTALRALEDDLTEHWPSPYGVYTPDYPMIAFTYDADPDRAGDLIVCALARHLTGRDDDLPWEDVSRCLNELGSKQTKPLRAVVKDALLPWALLRDTPGGATPPSPSQDSLLGAEHMAPEVARAVLEAGPSGGGRPTTDAARAVIEAYYRALGYRDYRGSLVDAETTHRVKLGKRGLQLFEGQPGAWVKVKATRGREVLLTDAAVHLLEVAERRARQSG